MFDTLFAKHKLAEIEFRDPEKFRSIPSLALPAVCVLDEYITKDMRVFEWGSGASTLFFAQRCAVLISVEHGAEWFRKVQDALAYKGISSLIEGAEEWFGDTFTPLDYSEFLRTEAYSHYVQHHFVPAGDGLDNDFSSFQPGFETVNFKDYVRVIDTFPDNHFDVVLVDGRARCACLEIAQAKLKPGGLLILDDSARMMYQWAMARINWPVMHLEGCIPFYKHGHVVRTTFWVKDALGGA